MPWSNVVLVMIVMALAIPLLAILRRTSSPRQQRRESKEREDREQCLQSEIADLRERVETLERIVTDGRYDLRREFETLNR